MGVETEPNRKEQQKGAKMEGKLASKDSSRQWERYPRQCGEDIFLPSWLVRVFPNT